MQFNLAPAATQALSIRRMHHPFPIHWEDIAAKKAGH